MWTELSRVGVSGVFRQYKSDTCNILFVSINDAIITYVRGYCDPLCLLVGWFVNIQPTGALTDSRQAVDR